MSDTISWPPLYTLIKHRKTRHIKFKASIKNGLQICVPPCFNAKTLPELLEENRTWIEKQLKKIQESTHEEEKKELPHVIFLYNVAQPITVRYIPSDSTKIRLLENTMINEIVLYGDIKNTFLCSKALSQWAKEKAKTILSNQLYRLSNDLDLPITGLTVKNQKTSWGSCTSDKKINLSYKVIFLPTYLADHILLHELCHTKHMNHSAAFWRAVAKIDPLWKKHSKEARRADHYIPWWAI